MPFATPIIVRVDFDNLAHARDFLTLLDHYAHHPMGGGTGLSPYAKAHLIERLQDRLDFVALLAYVDGHPAGLINLIEGFSTFSARPVLNIHDIVVHQDFRGQGIAKQLLLAAEHIAHERDCCKLTLEVLSGNQLARQLYEKVGYQAYTLDPAMGQAMFFEKKLPAATQAG
ncbi:GNAT family N-acetyltransferase [Chitinivorax tropicus]|nr:GNAT family N-acetyltransferase [Chitinivorax tropicus]